MDRIELNNLTRTYYDAQGETFCALDHASLIWEQGHMVTHDPYAASYTDRILYFKDGHIISELQRHDAERRRFYEAIMQESARQDEKR